MVSVFPNCYLWEVATFEESFISIATFGDYFVWGLKYRLLSEKGLHGGAELARISPIQYRIPKFGMPVL